jgi:hypothetical protein
MNVNFKVNNNMDPKKEFFFSLSSIMQILRPGIIGLAVSQSVSQKQLLIVDDVRVRSEREQ